MTRAATVEALTALGVERYRGDQVFRWVHHRGADDFAAMTDLGKPLRAKLVDAATIGRLAVDEVQVSRDGTRKLRLTTSDGRAIESVLIPDGPPPQDGGAEGPVSGYASAPDDDEEDPADPTTWRRKKLTLCISSQVGCALDCTFCATATLGFGRQLTAGEIVDQVYRAHALLDGLAPDDPTKRAGASRITNLVYMGMGEPLHNLKEVLRSLEILTDPLGQNLSARRITVSTAGLVPAIVKFGEAPLRANLAVSLNATTDAVRDEIMPINRKWNIAALLAAVRAFPLQKRQRVTFEYVLLDGVNDSLDDAKRLPDLLRGIPAKVNVIPWNPHPLAPYGRPSARAVETFQNELKARGLAVYVRRPRGDDIDAACGQLAARAEPALIKSLSPRSRP
ncbi:MAG: 23S rRNA (adenine(2503)-C(2))-methyltransferase RlmN [Myxococcales bacterium]|nr:23S rRNA (adenine(2503)-C(2))-methyltransferase RlmN [Myxococcales bacterium]